MRPSIINETKPRSRKKSLPWLSILCLGSLVAACTQFQKPFQATPNNYFPKRVVKLFPNAERFNQEFPSIKAAKSSLHLISVKKVPIAPPDSTHLHFHLSQVEGHSSLEFFKKQSLLANLFELNSQGTLPTRKDLEVSHILFGPKRELSYQSEKNLHLYDFNKSKPITSGTALKSQASFSKDGQHLVYVDGTTGNGDLYLYSKKKNTTIRLTDSLQTESNPRFHPFLPQIIYTKIDSKSSDLYLYDLRNQLHTRITQTNMHLFNPTYSPDGNFLAFYGALHEQDSQWNLYTIDYRTSSPKNTMTKVAKRVVFDMHYPVAWNAQSSMLFFAKQSLDDFNPIYAYDIVENKHYLIQTNTKMNRQIQLSKDGILSFISQEQVWDQVYIALTNQGKQLL